MANLTDGRVLKPDFSKISVKEYRQLGVSENLDYEDELIGRVYGMSGEELRELPWIDYKALTKEFLAAARDPVGYDPN
jgi:hypothetical protein